MSRAPQDEGQNDQTGRTEMEDLCASSLTFFSDQRLCCADVLPPAEARARIEVAVLSFLRTLTSHDPAISHLPLINRTLRNSRVNHGLLTDVSWIFLSHSFGTRSLMRANATKGFIRVWKVMEMCYQILLQEKRVTQRELYYKLLSTSSEYFTSQLQVNKAVQGCKWADIVALLRCSRYSLGIMASSRGLVAGRLSLQEPNKETVDCCSCGSSGYPISGDLNLLENLIMKTDAHYILLVEKHAIFQRLVDDHVFNQIPSILITAKGYPDIATRMSQNFPNLPILALVDWNPAGLAILCTFKFGSIGMGLEAFRYACNVKWLGLRGSDLELIPEESLLPLKPKDIGIAKSLMSSKLLQEKYQEELALMTETGQRAEIEALYFHGYDFLGKYIAKKIVQVDYI